MFRPLLVGLLSGVYISTGIKRTLQIHTEARGGAMVEALRYKP
jgi:hypothetical protein